jgi:hypothetical protein
MAEKTSWNYRMLVQQNDRTLGVCPIMFESFNDMDQYCETFYPGCFYASDVDDSPRVKHWLAKYGECGEKL